MADVKWIKITTDIFDDEKMLLIESLPEADSIIVIWFKLLCLAGKMNNSGVFMMNNRIAYTDKMLATIFRRKEATVKLALKTFEEFGMIEVIDGTITIPNWGKHQNLDQLEEKKQYMKEYMRNYRQKQKKLTGNSKLCENGLPMNEWKAVLEYFNHECAYCGSKEGLEQEHIIPVKDGGTYTIGNIVPACRSCNASKGKKILDSWYMNSEVFDEKRQMKLNEYRCKTNVSVLHKANVSSLDKNRIEVDKEVDKEQRINYQLIADMFNTICFSYPSIRSLSDARKKAIKARLNQYTVDDFKALFEKAEASDFLKGKNNKNWSATFDWLIKDANMAKVLDGNYDNRNEQPRFNNSGNKVAEQLEESYNMMAAWAEGGE